MSTYFINRQGERVDVVCTALGNVDVVSLTIDEAVNYDLFAVRGRTLSLTFLTDTAALYYNSLRGEGITIMVDNVTVFEGVISSTPSHQPYNYKLERFTVYADDSLTATKYLTYSTQESTLGAIFTTYLQSYIYTQVVNIDLTTARITLDMFTDTETNVFDVLTEVAKLLNIEICSRDGRAVSAIVGTAVATVAHFATTQLGVLDSIHAATVQIVEEAEGDSGGSEAQPEETATTWGTLEKKLVYVWRGWIESGVWYRPTGGVINDTYTGLFLENTYDAETGEITNREGVSAHNVSQTLEQYYRLGTTNGVTYLQNRAYEMQFAVNLTADGQPSVPEGVPSFAQRTLIYPTALYVGSDNAGAGSGSEIWERTFADLDLEQVYFTKRYSVTVPPRTTYKPRTYLIVSGDVALYPILREDGVVSFNNRTTCKMRYDHGTEQMHLKIRFYKASQLLYTTDETIWLDGAVTDAFNVKVKNNVNWNTGVTLQGHAIAFGGTMIDEADAIEVDFMGIGGWSNWLVNNTYNPTPDNPSNESGIYATLGASRCWQIQIPAYSVDLSFTFASGYLEETPPAEIDTTPATVAGEEETTFFYWNQDEGLDEITLSNRLNSLIERAGMNTVKVGDGYLQKVTSAIYSGSHYVEEYQLATIIDQRSTAASVLQIDTLALNRLITFNGVKYRLCGYSYDLEKGVYRCSYIEVKATTQID